MLDPGTAIGVASLAFDVSLELLKYFKAWKSCPADVLEIRATLLWLSQTFLMIRKTLKDHDESMHPLDEVQLRTIVTEVENCELQIKDLKSQLQHIQKESPDLLEKIKNQARRFKYPIKKSSIEKMLKTLQECQNTIHGTISLLSLGTSVNVVKHLELLRQGLDSKDQELQDFLNGNFKGLSDSLGSLKVNEEDRHAFLDEFDDLKMIMISQQSYLQTINNYIRHDITQQKFEKVLEWLLPFNQRKDYVAFHSSQYNSIEKGTGIWFVSGTIFQAWQKQPNSCVWLQGPVGCGKTVLCSNIIYELQKRCKPLERGGNGDILAYFYFSHRDDSLRRLNAMLCSFIAQLGATKISLPLLNDFYEIYHTDFMPTEPGEEEHIELLFDLLEQLRYNHNSTNQSTLAASPSNVFLVIDALDEVPFGSFRDDVLEFIRALRELQLDHIHLLLTSRFERDIQESLEDLDHPKTNQELLQMEPEQPLTVCTIGVEEMKQDIETLVKAELRRNSRLKQLPADSQQLIVERLGGQKTPMFRWAALQLKTLKEIPASALSHDTLLETLKCLPNDLNDTYQRILDNVDDHEFNPVYDALRWLIYARRPLRIGELVDACSFNNYGRRTFEESRRLTPSNLTGILSDLIKLEEDSDEPTSGRVSLAHFSVEEYFVNKVAHSANGKAYDLNETFCHKFLATCCLEYVVYANTLHKRRSLYPLREYAWNCWAWHCISVTGRSISSSDRALALVQLFAHPSFTSTEEMNDFLSTVLWALTDWGDPVKEPSLLRSLQHPYFYDEFLECDLTGQYGNYPQTKYVHSRLKDPHEHLRLIELLPSENEFDEIRCRAMTVESYRSSQFEVITYMCNMYRNNPSIRVNGQPFKIPPGLFSVLRRLRSLQRGRTRTLWLDALSINQEDLDENTTMVYRMPEIWRLASAHAIFADANVTDDDGMAVEILKEIDRLQCLYQSAQGQNLIRLKKLVGREISAQCAILKLFQGRIWSRLWTIQEMILSAEATLFFGSQQISINVIERVLKEHKSTQDLLKKVVDRTDHDFDSAFIDNRGWGAAIEMAALRKRYRLQGGIPLLRVLYATRYLLSWHPSDRLFAILNLTDAKPKSISQSNPLITLHKNDARLSSLPKPDIGNSELGIDYSNPPQVVLTSLLIFVLRSYDNLDVFSFLPQEGIHWDDFPFFPDARDIPLPSWTSTFHVGKQEILPFLANSFLSSSPDDVFFTCSDQSFPIYEFKYPYTLVLQGYQIDDISFSCPPLFTIDYEHAVQQRSSIWVRMQGIAQQQTLDGARHATIETYWRTVMADQLQLYQRMSSDIESRLLPRLENDEQSLDPKAGRETGLQYSKGRSFFMTKLGRMGLGPPTVQQDGGIVVIFPGGKMAYILRHQGDCYELLGDCYIQGIMDGEAMEELKGMPMSEFPIV